MLRKNLSIVQGKAELLTCYLQHSKIYLAGVAVFKHAFWMS